MHIVNVGLIRYGYGQNWTWKEDDKEKQSLVFCYIEELALYINVPKHFLSNLYTGYQTLYNSVPRFQSVFALQGKYKYLLFIPLN